MENLGEGDFLMDTNNNSYFNESSTLNMFRFLTSSTVNGPGSRAVIWVQGCKHNCPGCFNKGSWPIVDNEVVEIDNLIKKIVSIQNLEGVTFSGGEPLLQAEPLSKIACKLKTKGLSVMCYTGFTWKEIQGMFNDVCNKVKIRSLKLLLQQTDILITGRYVKELQPNRKWIGSSNQEVLFLSNRYRHLKSSLETNKKEWEFHISIDGSSVVTGFLPDLIN